MAQRSSLPAQDYSSNRSSAIVRACTGPGFGGWVMVCAFIVGMSAGLVAQQTPAPQGSGSGNGASAAATRTSSTSPKLFPWLLQFVEAKGNDSQRDALLGAHRRDLVDGFRRLLEVAIDTQVNDAQDATSEDAIEALRDFGARAKKLFSIGIFAEDADLVLSLSESQLARRARGTASLYQRMGALMSIASSRPASHLQGEDRLSPELAGRWDALHGEALQILSALEKLSVRLEDNDLMRTVLAFRPLAIRLGTDGVLPALHDERLKHLSTLIDTLKQQGVGSDSRVFFAFRERMQIWLAKSDLAAAERELGNARRTLKPESLRPTLFATWLETELSYFVEQGFDYAINNAADRLAALLPGLRESLPEYESNLQQQTVSQKIASWSYQVAYAQSLAGAHSKAWATLAQIKKLPFVASETLPDINLLASVEAETLGLWEESLKAARTVLASPAAPEKKWQAHLQIAACESLRGNIAEAATALAAARSREQSLKSIEGGPRLMSRAWLIAARVERMQGKLEPALAATAKALEYADESGHTLETNRALWFSSALHLQVGNPQRALSEAGQAQALAENAKVSAPWQQFISDLVIAEVFLSLGRPADALDTLKACKSRENEFLEDLSSLRGEFGRLYSLAQWTLLRKRLLDSIARLDNSAHMAAPGAKVRSSEKIVIERHQDEIRALIDQVAKSIEDLKDHSPRRFDLPSAATETLRAYELLFEITHRTQRPERAMAIAREAEAYTATLNRPAGSQRNLAWREVDAQAAILRGLAALENQSVDAALKHFKKAKALEHKLRGDLRWHAPDGLSARFESLTDRMIALQMEAACMQSSSPARVDEALFFLGNQRSLGLRSHLASMAKDNEPSAPKPINAKTLNALRAEHRLILIYAITGRGSYVLAIKGDHTSVHRLSLPGSARGALGSTGASQRRGLSRMTKLLTEAMVAPAQLHSRKSFLHFSKALYRFLVGPVESLLPGTKELVIIGDGDVHRVPFAALVQCQSSSDKVDHLPLREIPFIALREELEAISFVPSLATFAALEERDLVKAKKAILLLGDPHTGSSPVPALSKAGEEVQAVGAMYGSEESTILRGSGATFNELKSALPGQFGILHFAAHTETSPEPVMLLASEKLDDPMRKVTISEIMDLDLVHTDLVVLSSCRSHMGPQLGAEGLINLPRAFIIAGAQRVMASVADVRDDQTSVFMRKFYENLRNPKAKRGPAAALLETQRDLLRSGTAILPLGWAPFVIIGTP